MKSFLVLFALLSLSSAFAALNTEVECYRDFQNTKITYAFHFDAPRVVSAKVTGVTNEGESTFTPKARSVLYSEGRLVGFQDEISGDEELFLLPHAVFNPTQIRVRTKVEVMLRGNSHFYVECQGI